MEERNEKKGCPFFDICAAYIIQEKLGKNWSQAFCFDDFKNCYFFGIRNKPRAFITRKGKKIEIETSC